MHEFYNICNICNMVDPFQFFNRESYTSGSSYGSSSSAPSQSPRRYDYWHVPTSAEIAAAVAPTKYAAVDLTKYSCDNPYDLEDLYYYISPKNGQGPYIPQPTDGDIRDYARIKDGRTIWTQGTIPNTSATGCRSQDLMAPNLGRFFGVQVDGLNKVIIDAYNAQFPNPPTPVPLKTKYFYYTRFINRDTSKEYFPARFTTRFRLSLKLNSNRKIRCDNLISDTCWGKPQKIPNTNAIGFVIIDGEGQGAYIYVRVDRANNAIIEAYNESLNTPLPTSSASEPTTSSTSSLPPLPPGWEELKEEPSGRIYYGNPTLKIVQYAFPTTPSSSSTPAPAAQTPAPAAPVVPAAPVAAPAAPAPVATQSPDSATAPAKAPTPSSTSSSPTSTPSSTNDDILVKPSPPSSTASSTSSLPPLPPGWEEFKEPSGKPFYGYPPLKYVQYARPIPLPSGWEYLKDKSGKLYYGNPSQKIAQYDFPAPPTSSPPPPSAPATPVFYYLRRLQSSLFEDIPQANVESTLKKELNTDTPPRPTFNGLIPGTLATGFGWKITGSGSIVGVVGEENKKHITAYNDDIWFKRQSEGLTGPPPPPLNASLQPSSNTVYKIGNKTFSPAELTAAINSNSICPQGTSVCQITTSSAAAGGSKNKKHGRRTNRRHKVSRRKASRRRTGKK